MLFKKTRFQTFIFIRYYPCFIRYYPCLYFQVSNPAESQIPNNYVNTDYQNSPASLEPYLSLHVKQKTLSTKFKYLT